MENSELTQDQKNGYLCGKSVYDCAALKSTMEDCRGNCVMKKKKVNSTVNPTFTPGQWEILGKGNGTHFIGTLTEERQIKICEVDIPIHDWPMSKQEAEFNAKLIAAAPELLEALKMILALLDENEGSASWYLRKHYDQINNAIKKATE